jgi:DNA-binding PadR family transcriptional regulator
MTKRLGFHARSPSLPGIYIMLALADGARHGYALKQEIERRTGGLMRLGPGTLYETIQRLEDGGLIEEAVPGDPANGQQAQRRYYALTDRGWRTLREEVRRLGELVDHARAHPRLA